MKLNESNTVRMGGKQNPNALLIFLRSSHIMQLVLILNRSSVPTHFVKSYLLLLSLHTGKSSWHLWLLHDILSHTHNTTNLRTNSLSHTPIIYKELTDPFSVENCTIGNRKSSGPHVTVASTFVPHCSSPAVNNLCGLQNVMVVISSFSSNMRILWVCSVQWRLCSLSKTYLWESTSALLLHFLDGRYTSVREISNLNY